MIGVDNMIIDERVLGTTRMIALIGNPIEHTISPFIHNTLSSHLGKNLIYVPFKVEKNRLDYVVEAFRELGVVGFNVTVPYKREIMRFLDEKTRDALLMGAVNTVKVVGGKLFGYNTDAEGFCRAFKEETGYNFLDKSIIIIGAGGTARAIAVKVAMEGARRIAIVNRTLSKAAELAEIVNYNVSEVVGAYGPYDNTLPLLFEESDIIINTTAVGMYPEVDELPFENMDYIQDYHIVYDVIYNPFETKFLKMAREKGASTFNGLGMLIQQGVSAFEIWSGLRIEENLIFELSEKIKEKILL